MKKTSKELWIAITLALAVDYFLAKLLSPSDEEVFLIFALLVLAPMLFAIKSAIVRILLWKLRGEKISEEDFLKKMINGGWSEPDSESENAMSYLERVCKDEAVSIDQRFVAAKLLGAVEGLFETQQIVSAYQVTSAIKQAMIKYESSHFGSQRV